MPSFNESASNQDVQRENRLLRLQITCQRILSRATDVQELLSELAAALVDSGQYQRCLLLMSPGLPETLPVQICYPAEKRSAAGCAALRDLATQAQALGDVQVQTTASGSELIALPIPGYDRNGSSGAGCLALEGAAAESLTDQQYTLLQDLLENLRQRLKQMRSGAVLQERSEQFNSLTEASMVGFYIIQQGRFAYVNARLAELFGYTQAEMLDGIQIADLIYAEDRDEVESNLRQRLDGETQSVHYRFRGVTRSGELIYVEVFGSRTHYQGEPAVVGSLLDVTDRQSAEQRLNLLSRAVEASRNGIAISDLSLEDKPFVYVNSAFEAITGYSSAEIIGRNGRFLLGDETDQSQLQQLRQALSEQRGTRVELRNYRKDGAPFWNELSIAPVRDDTGNTTHYVSVVNDISQRKQIEHQLLQLSNFDKLTGLANRSQLSEQLQQALHHARRKGRVTALVMLDLDRFKIFNQSLGTLAGDRILCAVAKRLEGVIRRGDTVARVGADEFAILFNDLNDRNDLLPLASKVLNEISRNLDVGPDGLRVTASMGISVAPGDGDDAELLIQNASAAMYSAMPKHNGFVFYTAELNSQAQQRLEMEVRLKRAITNNEFVLHFQPKVDLLTGKVTGAEALVRWDDPEEGMVPPFRFIPLAEESGLIQEIGAWVMEEACRVAGRWNKEGWPLTMAVNLSAKQFTDPDLVGVIQRAFLEGGLPPHLLECELTESVLMEQPDIAKATLSSLKETGIHIALDDFGTGYSSLSYLKRFPIDTLKIDRSFVMDIPEDDHDIAIAKAIIALSRSLGLQVVAEGVETSDQLAFLQQEGCDLMQGFYFSKPLPEDVFRQLLVAGTGLDNHA